jgi:hypothetical protein
LRGATRLPPGKRPTRSTRCAWDGNRTTRLAARRLAPPVAQHTTLREAHNAGVRATRLLAAERAKLDHDRRLTPLTRFCARGRFQASQSPRGGCVLRDPSYCAVASRVSIAQAVRPMAARHHYELGRNASAQIYSPAQRLASHSFVRRSRASVRLPGLASRDGWKIDRYHAAALHPMVCVAMSMAVGRKYR